MLKRLFQSVAERLGLPSRSVALALLGLGIVFVLFPVVASIAMALLSQVVIRQTQIVATTINLGHGPQNGQLMWHFELETNLGYSEMQAFLYVGIVSADRRVPVPYWSQINAPSALEWKAGTGVHEVALGWPFRMVVARVYSSPRADGTAIVLSRPNGGIISDNLDLKVIRGEPYLPLRVIVPGVLGNLAIFSLGVVVFLLARARVMRKGDGVCSCAACGYSRADLAAGTKCPECGAESARRRM